MTVANEKKTQTTQYARRRSIQAYRAGSYILLVAEGALPTPGYEADIEQNPIRIFPPHFDLVQRRRPGMWPQVETPYAHAEFVRYPAEATTVTVHHADGQDEVIIEKPGAGVSQFTEVAPMQLDAVVVDDEAIGTSPNLSFDEAFRAALENLPDRDPAHPDELTTVQVVETGGLFGGIAGFRDLYVRVRRTVN